MRYYLVRDVDSDEVVLVAEIAVTNYTCSPQEHGRKKITVAESHGMKVESVIFQKVSRAEAETVVEIAKFPFVHQP